MAEVDRSALPLVGPDPPFTFPTVVRHTLANGLRVRTVEHRGMPVVTFAVQIEGGSSVDPAGGEGLAAVVADMADEGIGELSAIDVSDALARIGADYDVETGPDALGFTLTTLTRFAERGASLLASMIARPSLRVDDFDRVRQLRLDRLRQLRDLPGPVAERAFLRLLYGSHPYGHLSIGTEAALGAMRLEDVAAFHGRWVWPSATTVVAVGHLSHAVLLRVVEDAFGDWAAPPPASPSAGAPDPTAEPARTPGLVAVVPRDGAAQSELRIGHVSARRGTPDYVPLLVMNAVLGGQFVSRINLKLREEKGLTYGARTGFDWRRGPAPFAVYTSVHTAATAEAVRDALDELEGVRGARPVTEPELALAKASLTRGYPRGFETASQVARAVAQLVLYDLPDSSFEDFVPKVTAVGAAEVTAAAARYIDPASLTVLAVGDRAAIEAPLGALGRGAPRILPGDA